MVTMTHEHIVLLSKQSDKKAAAALLSFILLDLFSVPDVQST